MGTTNILVNLFNSRTPVWDFFVSDDEPEGTVNGPGVYRIMSNFLVSSNNTEALEYWKLGDEFIYQDAARYLAGEVSPLQKLNLPGAVSGTRLWTITDYTNSDNPIFRIEWGPDKQVPGILLLKNESPIYTNVNLFRALSSSKIYQYTPSPASDTKVSDIVDANLVEYGNNIVAEGDTVKFNGSSSYTRFADIGDDGVDYGQFVRSGTWSMTFWIKPMVDTSQEIRFLVLRRSADVDVFMITNKGLFTSNFGDTQLSLTENTWHFFTLSVEDHHWTIHTSINGSGLTSTFLGEWNISSMASNQMFFGVNNGGGTVPYGPFAFWWDGYASNITIHDHPLTAGEAKAIHASTMHTHTPSSPDVWEFFAEGATRPFQTV
jgi:hypothetical protein